MSTQNLLDMTQEILESMESDIVDSINDTAESTAVARMIRRTYWDLFGVLEAPESFALFKLEETSASTPILMTLPSNVMSVEWIKYNREIPSNTDDVWTTIAYYEQEDFLASTLQLTESAENTVTFDYTFRDDPIRVMYMNNAAPQWYTTFDQSTILFNSYDVTEDTYLKAAKTMCYGLVDETFQLTDTYVPPLNARQFPLLYNTAKAQCFAELKQAQNVTAEQRSRRLLISSQHNKDIVTHDSYYNTLGYGRK